MTKLNQILAIESGLKSKTARKITDIYHSAQKTALFGGMSRVYTPDDADDVDQLPSEGVLLQLNAEDLIKQLINASTRLIDVTATKDATNNFARADIVVDGVLIATEVSAVTMLFLEKQIEDLGTFISKLPVLDPAKHWQYDSNRSAWVADVEKKRRSKKLPKPIVLYDATDKHPAQVQMIAEDINVGTWAKTEFSGALPGDRILELKDRLENLRVAVKQAREQANMVEVIDVKIGQKLLSYLFDGVPEKPPF